MTIIRILTKIIKTIALKNYHKTIDFNDNDHASNNFEKDDKNINNENNKEELNNLFSVDLNISKN